MVTATVVLACGCRTETVVLLKHRRMYLHPGRVLCCDEHGPQEIKHVRERW